MSELPGPCSTSLPHPNRQQQHRQTNGLQLQSFQLSHTEQSGLKKLRQELDTYIMQKHIHSTDCRPETEQLDHSEVINIQDYMRVVRPAETEKSNIVYLQVLDAI